REVEKAVRAAAGACLESVEFVDLYRGKQIDDGKKSLAFRLTYRDPRRTLTGEEVDGFQAAVVARLTTDFAARVRR
ncbi:MAG: hypothetical protein ACRDD1_14540, partial [Planctomycetia bacterium]